MTHPTWELKINPNKDDAALILTPCPGTKETELEASLKQLKTQGVQAIVTALSTEEMEKKQVQDLGEITQSLGMQWYHAPIEDDCAPDHQFADNWAEISPSLHKIIESNGKVALHCFGGSGRTGLLAAHLLLEKGWDLNLIKQQVKELRPGAFTKQIQIDYIQQVASK